METFALTVWATGRIHWRGSFIWVGWWLAECT
jgi:hypothetical protein